MSKSGALPHLAKHVDDRHLTDVHGHVVTEILS